MKRLLAVLLAFITVFSLCSCNPDNSTGVGENLSAQDILSDAFIDPVIDWKLYDDLIAQIKTETDYSKRAELMHKAEDILMANGCIIPLYYYNDVYMHRAYVKNVYCNSFGHKYFYNGQMTNGATTLRINLAGEPISLDPAFCTTVDSASLAVNSFAGLYTYINNGNTVPDLATGYTVSESAEDGTVTFTVTLLDNLKWSDGSSLTAKDFEYSWKRAAADITESDNASLFSMFVGYPNDLKVSATSNTTLVFTLTTPCPYIESLLASPAFFPVNKASVESYNGSPDKWCQEAGFISNGPFICTGWKHDKSLTFEKNPYYHKASEVTIEKLYFTLSTQDADIYSKYKAGDIDFIDNIPADTISSLKNNSEFFNIDILGTYYISFNVNSELFKNKTSAEAACMRLAFNMLIDRNYICQSVGQTGQIPASSYTPVGMKDGNGSIFKANATENAYYNVKAINDSPEDALDLARKYLVAAGYKFDESGKLSNQTPIVIKYLTDDSADHVAVAKSIQADLKELDIDMIIQQVDYNTFIQERKQGNFDIVRAGWLADINDPISMLEIFTTDSSNNYCHFGRNRTGNN